VTIWPMMIFFALFLDLCVLHGHPILNAGLLTLGCCSYVYTISLPLIFSGFVQLHIISSRFAQYTREVIYSCQIN